MTTPRTPMAPMTEAEHLDAEIAQAFGLPASSR
jgi:hypothetical protein